MLGIEDRLSHGEVRASFDFFLEATQLSVNIFRDRVYCHADGVICCAAQTFSGPVGPLIEPRENLYQANGVYFIDAAGFGVIAERRRVSGDGEDVAHASHGPSAEQHRLQTDD